MVAIFWTKWYYSSFVFFIGHLNLRKENSMDRGRLLRMALCQLAEVAREIRGQPEQSQLLIKVRCKMAQILCDLAK